MKAHKYFALVASATFAVAPFARATDSVSITQIAVTGAPVPGTGGTFTSFGAPTTNRDVDQNIPLNPFFFLAQSSNGNSGAYAYDALSNSFADLADTTMSASTGGYFASFSSLSSGQGAVGLIATDSNGTQGVYVEGYNALTLVATPSTSPAAGITFGAIQNISIAGNPYGSPAGFIESTAGVYLFITNPNGSYSFYGGVNNFSLTSIGPVSYKGSIGNSNVVGVYQEAGVFAATVGGVRSIYYFGPGSVTSFTTVASIGGTIPTGSGQFVSFGNPVVTANEVAFTAHYETVSGDQQGIFIFGSYLSGGGVGAPLSQIVATGQIAPNSGGATFTGFSDLSDTSFDESFVASLSNGGEGLYVNVNEGSPAPQLVKVVATGDVLDGQIVQSIELAPDASNYYSGIYTQYSNAGIGFEVNFTDGSEGVYYFDINLPEPASLALLAFPMQLIRRRRESNTEKFSISRRPGSIDPIQALCLAAALVRRVRMRWQASGHAAQVRPLNMALKSSLIRIM